MLAAHCAHPTKPLYHLDMASSMIASCKDLQSKSKTSGESTGTGVEPGSSARAASGVMSFVSKCVTGNNMWTSYLRDMDFNSCWLNEHAHCLAKQIISMQFLLSHYHCRFVECLAASTARSISRKVFFLHKLVRRQLWTPAMRCKRNLEMTGGVFCKCRFG